MNLSIREPIYRERRREHFHAPGPQECDTSWAAEPVEGRGGRTYPEGWGGYSVTVSRWLPERLEGFEAGGLSPWRDWNEVDWRLLSGSQLKSF